MTGMESGLFEDCGMESGLLEDRGLWKAVQSLKQKEALQECLELLNAIETLEYYNKNWLATFANRSPADVNKEKRALLERAIKIVGSSAEQRFT